MLLQLDSLIQKNIISFLSHYSISSLEQTCRYFSTLISNNGYFSFKNLCKRHARFKSFHKYNAITWKAYYQQLCSTNVLGLRRLQRELLKIEKEPLPNVKVRLKGDHLLLHWLASIIGPDGSPYEGKVFFLDIIVPETYPFKPPKITFTTPILHVNISKEGIISLDILQSNKWSPAFHIVRLLLAIIHLLETPNPDDPLVPSLAKLYIGDQKEHDRQVREHAETFSEKVMQREA